MTGYPQPQFPGFGGDRQVGPQGYGPSGPADDQTWGMLSYVLSFVAAILAPLIIYLVKMNESRFVRYHAAQALNMGITAFIYSVCGVIIGVVVAIASHGLALLVLIPLFIAYAIAHVVFLILAAIGAYRGTLYRVPFFLCLPLVR